LIFFNWIGPDKNKIGIAIKFCKCYVIKRSPSNFLNKTQLKIKIKNDFFNWFGPGSMYLALDQTWSGRNSEEWLHCHLNSGVELHCGRLVESFTLHWTCPQVCRKQLRAVFCKPVFFLNSCGFSIYSKLCFGITKQIAPVFWFSRTLKLKKT
jgi:hypothetical protein